MQFGGGGGGARNPARVVGREIDRLEAENGEIEIERKGERLWGRGGRAGKRESDRGKKARDGRKGEEVGLSDKQKGAFKFITRTAIVRLVAHWMEMLVFAASSVHLVNTLLGSTKTKTVQSLR